MSNKKILNKKYIFLQNLFYQSIPISLPENNKDTILNSLKKTRRVSGPSKGGFAPLSRRINLRNSLNCKFIIKNEFSVLIIFFFFFKFTRKLG